MKRPVVRNLRSNVSNDEYHHMCNIIGTSSFVVKSYLGGWDDCTQACTLEVHGNVTPQVMLLVDLLLSELIVIQ